MFALNFLLLFFLRISSVKGHHVNKRTLLFPEFTIYQFTYGLTVPAILPKRSVNINGCLQNNFQLPINITQLSPSIIEAKSGEESDYDLDRNTFYKYVIGILDEVGLNGEHCLLRSICELAEIPMHVEETNSLLESVMHFLLTPSEDQPRLTNSSSNLNGNYLDAENIGKTSGKCHEEFFDCPFSLIDFFTKFYYV